MTTRTGPQVDLLLVLMVLSALAAGAEPSPAVGVGSATSLATYGSASSGGGLGHRPVTLLESTGSAGLFATPNPSSGFTAVSAGSLHTCGLGSDSSIECWGYDGSGRATPPVGLFVAVSAGGTHTCGLRSDGSVECWGDDGLGQAGAPVGLFVAVSAGGTHTCGLRSDGSVECWGDDGLGQAGAPVGLFVAVSAGGRHTCGLRSDGSVECWGDDGLGQAGAPAGSFTAVSTGTWHSCALGTDGSVVCWGYDGSGRATPPARSFTEVSAGSLHTCGLGTDGSVVCWGYDGSGQAAAPAGSFTAVSAGHKHSCGLRIDGYIECWGDLSAVLTAAGTVGGGSPAVEGEPPGEDAGVHQPSVEALRSEFPGLFDGTGCGQRLCPEEPLRRWEMAVWLVRVLDRANPARQTAGVFDDVDAGLWWASYAYRLSQLKVTNGCTTASFCSREPVTRAQMATFLVRALDLAAGSGSGFVDTAGNLHEASIDSVTAARITAGCATDPPRYCPREPVTRGQMATFLARALDLI